MLLQLHSAGTVNHADHLPIGRRRRKVATFRSARKSAFGPRATRRSGIRRLDLHRAPVPVGAAREHRASIPLTSNSRTERRALRRPGPGEHSVPPRKPCVRQTLTAASHTDNILLTLAPPPVPFPPSAPSSRHPRRRCRRAAHTLRARRFARRDAEQTTRRAVCAAPPS